MVPNYLSAGFWLSCDDLARNRQAAGFRPAGTGRGEGNARRELVRSDDSHWIDRESATLAQARLWANLDALMQAFNRKLFLGLADFEGHYAAYPPGGFYRRHLDTFQGGSTRVVTVVLYLNESWRPGDGGELRVHDSAGGHVDVEPRGGTLVCFMSREAEHEVLASRVERLSFTGWFRRRA